MAFESSPAAASRPWSKDERRAAWRGVDQAHVMGVELIAAILTWAGIGYLLDRWLGTTPWLLVVGALIGNAAGIYLVWLRSSRMEGGASYDGSAYNGSLGAAADDARSPRTEPSDA